jgi:hypothetical protein
MGEMAQGEFKVPRATCPGGGRKQSVDGRLGAQGLGAGSGIWGLGPGFSLGGGGEVFPFSSEQEQEASCVGSAFPILVGRK